MLPLLVNVHSGIGLESALVFAGDGAHVVVADINIEAANRAVETIQSQVPDAPKAIAVKCDVSKEADIEAAVKAAVDTFGRLDVMLCVWPARVKGSGRALI